MALMPGISPSKNKVKNRKGDPFPFPLHRVDPARRGPTTRIRIRLSNSSRTSRRSCVARQFALRWLLGPALASCPTRCGPVSTIKAFGSQRLVEGDRLVSIFMVSSEDIEPTVPARSVAFAVNL